MFRRLTVASALLSGAAAAEPKVDGPVQVYIMMGQSNMLGEGRVLDKSGQATNGTLTYAVQTEHKYPYLWDSASGTWAVSKTVRNVFTMGSGGPTSRATIFHNEFMGVNTTHKKTIGPELGIGFTLGSKSKAPIMTLKTCIGNRALGWDLLPPGSKSFDYTDSKGTTYTYAGYHESPNRWVKGTTPKPISWVAGIQYDGDIFRAGEILGNLSTFYPGASSYEIAGFFWWQGDRDSRDMALAGQYESNLVNLIKALRKHFKAPNAKFVTASLGQTAQGATDGGGLILDAMENVGCNAPTGKCKYPEFKGNVATVYTKPLVAGPGSSGSHYGGNAETYMNIGQAMGAAMNALLDADQNNPLGPAPVLV